MRLELKNISKTFDSTAAVRDLSLVVPDGVLYGIIGPNGAGKTTTIRMIMNIIVPDTGEIHIDGASRQDTFNDRVGYLPEERGLYRKMTVSEVMSYMAELKGRKLNEISAAADSWLERMDLIAYKNRKVEELSKGMQQKLQFITTILHDPDIIILDELFSGLDPINVELIKDALLELKRAGKTILFSTHVMEQAEKMCEHICMISKGRKVIDGRMSEVKSKFGKNSIHLEVAGDASFARELPGVKGFVDNSNFVELQLEEGANTDSILKAVAEKVSVRRFELVEPSLYNIFLEMAKVDPATLQAEGQSHA